VIKPEQIPDEVVKVLRENILHDCSFKHAIAAAINAWPRMQIHTDGTEDWIELILMQENNNGSD
jgi:hypothetical protein